MKTIKRNLNGEAIINEASGTMSREQIVLIPTTTGYKPNTILAKLTGGADAGKWCKFDPNGADGAQVPKGYLYESRPISTGTQRATALVRDADLNGKKILVDSAVAITTPQLNAMIAALSASNADGTGKIRVRY